MKEARIYVDFNEMVDEDLVELSETDFKENSKGKVIELKEGMKIKIYSDDLCGCNGKDNLLAEGIVELNAYANFNTQPKWNCRINKKGIYNESQKSR